MHIDYAKEVVLHYENDKTLNNSRFHKDRIDNIIIEKLSAENELLTLAESFNDKKITSICSTVRKSNDSQYKRVTDKQRYAIATFLLNKFKTARATLAKAFSTPEQEMFADS